MIFNTIGGISYIVKSTRADKSAMGAIHRPLQNSRDMTLFGFSSYTYDDSTEQTANSKQ